jgi:hypothetical protein
MTQPRGGARKYGRRESGVGAVEALHSYVSLKGTIGAYLAGSTVSV